MVGATGSGNGSEPELVIDAEGVVQKNATAFLITREMMERDRPEGGWMSEHFASMGDDELCVSGFGRNGRRH